MALSYAKNRSWAFGVAQQRGKGGGGRGQEGEGNRKSTLERILMECRNSP